MCLCVCERFFFFIRSLRNSFGLTLWLDNILIFFSLIYPLAIDDEMKKLHKDKKKATHKRWEQQERKWQKISTLVSVRSRRPYLNRNEIRKIYLSIAFNSNAVCLFAFFIKSYAVVQVFKWFTLLLCRIQNECLVKYSQRTKQQQQQICKQWRRKKHCWCTFFYSRNALSGFVAHSIRLCCVLRDISMSLFPINICTYSSLYFFSNVEINKGMIETSSQCRLPVEHPIISVCLNSANTQHIYIDVDIDAMYACTFQKFPNNSREA